jgi:hypothetical protein
LPNNCFLTINCQLDSLVVVGFSRGDERDRERERERKRERQTERKRERKRERGGDSEGMNIMVEEGDNRKKNRA